MECLGFHLYDTDITFRKNYLVWKSYYEEIPETNSTLCRIFEEAVKKGPVNKIKQTAADYSFEDLGKYASDFIPGFRQEDPLEADEEEVEEVHSN